MTTDTAYAPRCIKCEHILPRPGATCHVCDVEEYFEGAARTAPPMFMRPRDEARVPRPDRQAS